MIRSVEFRTSRCKVYHFWVYYILGLYRDNGKENGNPRSL